MRLFLLFAFNFVVGLLFARQITDMAGRQVLVPDKINRVIPYDNKTNVLLFPVAGELMVAKARSMESPYLKYISDDFLNIPEIDAKNAEEVLRMKPDVLIVAAFGIQDDLSRYEEFASKINIPCVVVDLELMNLDKSYDFLGKLLDKPEAAERCAELIRSVYQDVQMLTKGKKIAGTAYMANDHDGLRTAPNSSNHAQMFDVMKVTNAVRASLDARGFAQVSVEQVLAWNPDYVFCVGKGESSPYRTILKSAVWKNTAAVRSGRVYFVPAEPYLWFDIPPSVNRIPGLIWFNRIFYGQSPEVTMQKVKKFYRIFYGYDLTDKEYAGLFRWQ